MIKLSQIVEIAQAGQYYDLGRDFTNFRRAIDGADEQIKQKFEQAINAQLKGHRVRARSSRGYKQFEKDYEFDVSRVTIDDYYDNFVVIAHDDSGRKTKEYFLKPGVKISIIGPAATNMDSMDKQPKPVGTKIDPLPPMRSGNGGLATPSAKSSTVREDAANSDEHYDAYPIQSIIDDITPWAKILMRDTRIGAKDFVKGLGWMRELSNGQTIAIYDLFIPITALKTKLSQQTMGVILQKVSKPKGNIDVKFEVTNFDAQREGYRLRIKKTMTEKSPQNGEDLMNTFDLAEPNRT
jgi:hypothetical protein